MTGEARPERRPAERPYSNSPGDTELQGAAQRSPRAKWPFRLAAIALGLAPLFILEIAARLFGPTVVDAVDVNPVVEIRAPQPLFQLDAESGRWSIPETRFNYFRPASFAAVKPPQTKRIFVLGGSTVQGRPYSTETAFSSWLDLRLQAASADEHFEVVNCGGVSYASYRVAAILREALQHQPDAIVLYIGHNEFLEDRSYADARDVSTPVEWLNRIAAHSATVALVKRLAVGSGERIPAPALPSEVDTVLDHPRGLDRYHRDRNWKRRVTADFAATLRQMMRMIDDAKVPCIVCVPASDLVRTPPFKVELAPDLSATERADFARAWEVAVDPDRDPRQRRAACLKCLAIDPEHAGANYVLGVELYYSGDVPPTSTPNHAAADPQSAQVYLTAARDHDVCPLRATSEIVEAIEAIATDQGLPTVDVRQALDQRNSRGSLIPDGIPDPELFIDHVHPSLAGHQRIAAAIAKQFVSLGWINESQSTEQTYERLAKAQLAGLGEEYFIRGQQRLEGLRLWAAGRARTVGVAADPPSE